MGSEPTMGRSRIKSLWACENRDRCRVKEDCNFWMDRSFDCFKEELDADPSVIMINCDKCPNMNGHTFFEMKERRYDGNTEIEEDENEGVPEVRYGFGY